MLHPTVWVRMLDKTHILLFQTAATLIIFTTAAAWSFSKIYIKYILNLYSLIHCRLYEKWPSYDDTVHESIIYTLRQVCVKSVQTLDGHLLLKQIFIESQNYGRLTEVSTMPTPHSSPAPYHSAWTSAIIAWASVSGPAKDMSCHQRHKLHHQNQLVSWKEYSCYQNLIPAYHYDGALLFSS